MDIGLAHDRWRPPRSAGSRTQARIDGFDYFDGWIDMRRSRASVRLYAASSSLLVASVRQICMRLAFARGGLILHAAAIGCDGGCFIFAGRSGMGKSTVCRVSAGREIISEDLVAVWKRGGGFAAYGMPERGLPRRAGGRRILAVFVLRPDTQNRVVKLGRAAAIAGFLALPPPLAGGRDAVLTLERAEELARAVPCYRLHFVKTGRFWRIINRSVCSFSK